MENGGPSQHKFSTNNIKWIPVVKVYIMVFGIVVAYSIAINGGTVNTNWPFIRELGAEGRPRVLFAFMLNLASFLGIFMVICRYLVLHSQLLEMAAHLKCLNKLALWMGIGSMLSLYGMASIPMSTIMWLHLTFSMLYFFMSWMYLQLLVFIEGYLPDEDPFRMLKCLKKCLCFSLLFYLLGLIVTYPLAHYYWNTTDT